MPSVQTSEEDNMSPEEAAQIERELHFLSERIDQAQLRMDQDRREIEELKAETRRTLDSIARLLAS